MQTLPLQSNSTSDYVPNLSTAVRKKADLIISAGFLLADATNTVAKKNPNLHFAITDYDVKGAPFNGRRTSRGSPTPPTSRAASSATSRPRWRRSRAASR